jgi:hypothetical protein
MGNPGKKEEDGGGPEDKRAYHDCNGLPLVSDRDTTTAVGTVVPDIRGYASTTVNTGRKRVVDEAASAVLPAVFFSAAAAVSRTQANEGLGCGGRRCGLCKTRDRCRGNGS